MPPLVLLSLCKLGKHIITFLLSVVLYASDAISVHHVTKNKLIHLPLFFEQCIGILALDKMEDLRAVIFIVVSSVYF